MPFKLYMTVMEHPHFKDILQQIRKMTSMGEEMTILWNKMKRLKVDFKDLNIFMSTYIQNLSQSRKLIESI